MNKKELLKRFGKNVKIERIKKDLMQEMLAEIMDVSQNYIASIECGNVHFAITSFCTKHRNFVRVNFTKIFFYFLLNNQCLSLFVLLIVQSSF